jgi:hypothetical protein
MNLLEILSNFWAALVIFLAVAVGYVLFTLRHPHSTVAKDEIEASLKGCGVDTVVWCSIAGIAIGLGNLQYFQAEALFEGVVGTKIIGVPLIMWSMIFVPLAFAIHKAYGGFDYRWIAVSAFVIIGFFFAIYYTVTGLPLL